MCFVGIDHSTTGVKTAVVDGEGNVDTFVIERTPDEDGEWSFIDRLAVQVPLADIDLIANGYSYGDAFSEIMDIDAVPGRGVVDHMGAGHGFGTGTQVFDELRESEVPTVMMPGVHDGLDTFHPYFENYSVYSGADTVAMTRYAAEVVSDRTETEKNTFVTSCVSSSTMATLVVDGELTGGFHWIGLIHGHVDIDMLRQIDAGDQDPVSVFMESGLIFRSGKSFEQVKGVPDEELLEQVYWAAVQNVHALAPFANELGDSTLDEVVLSGRLARVEDPIDMEQRLTDTLGTLGPVHVCREFSTAIGAAYIARDVYQGESEILGIPVGTVPESVSAKVPL